MAANEGTEVLWSPFALRDIEAIHQFLSSRSRRGAREAVKAIQQGVERVRAHPEIGP
jgi:plasmid stabilization system protein ParE